MTTMKWMTMLLLVTGLFCAACGGNGAQELLETAELEELQHNPEHALSLYQEILDKYPDSPAAQKAQERIKVLQKDS